MIAEFETYSEEEKLKQVRGWLDYNKKNSPTYFGNFRLWKDKEQYSVHYKCSNGKTVKLFTSSDAYIAYDFIRFNCVKIVEEAYKSREKCFVEPYLSMFKNKLEIPVKPFAVRG